MSTRKKKLHILFLADPQSQNTIAWINGFTELGCRVSIATVRPAAQQNNIYPIGIPQFPPKLRILTAVHHLKELIKKLKPDILIAYRVTSYGYLAAKTNFFPIVIAAQNEYITWTSENIPFLSPVMGFFARYAIEKADMFHAWGENIKKGLIKYGAPERKIFVLHRGIDTDMFCKKESFREFPINNPILISTRSLYKEYKLDLLLASFAELVRSYPEAELIIAGEGPERKNLQSLAEKLKCSRNIHFKGKLSALEIAKELKKADIYISLIDTEGISSSLLEACATGILPVIVDMPASYEVIRKKNAALFLKKENLRPKAIADAIKTVLQDSNIFLRALTNSESIRKRFNRKENLKKFLEEYRKRFSLENVMSPHVCHVSTSHSPFDIRIFHRECKGLRKLGYKVSIVTRGTEKKEKIVDGIRIIPVKYILGKLGRKIILPKIAVTKARKLNADIYHFHDVELLPWMCMLAKHHNAKVIWDVHELYPATIKEFYIKHFPPLAWILSDLFTKFEKLWCASFASVIAVTEPIAKRYRDMGFDCITIKNVIDMEEVEKIREKRAVGERKADRFTIIISGTTNRSRCIDQILHAVNIVKSERYSVLLRILSDFDSHRDERRIRRLISKLNIEENVSISSSVPWEKLIAEEIPSAHIGLVLYQKSENNCAGIPNRLFEYWACGLPVIATNTPLLSEIIEKYGGGIVIDSDIPRQIANGIMYYINHTEKLTQHGQEGLCAVEKHFNWQIELAKLDELYRKIISTLIL